ncbi:MAG TPA: PAS domain S-box protein [Anaerolineae bacterium]|nr:PAS domain S-box protein [Anaerolineae bacterium]
MTAKTKAQLMAELNRLTQRVSELEAEQQQAIIEQERLLRAEREQRALAEALGQTVAVIGSSLRGEEVLDRILEEMSRVVIYDAACLLLIQGDLARVYRWRGYVRSGRATKTAIVSATFSIESVPVFRTVRKTGRPAAVARPAMNEQWVRKFGTAWVKSYACAPIRSRGQVIGFLAVDSETPDFYEASDAEVLQAYADQAAMALENVALHNRVRREIIKRVKKLKKERNFISAILDTADALVIALNRAGQIVHFNRACEQTSGYTFAEVKNRHVWELLPPENAAIIRDYFIKLSSNPDSGQSSRLPTRFETYLITKSGQRRLIACSNAVLFNKSGTVEYIIATGIDVTEQRQAEAALQESEVRFKALFEFAPDAYFFNDLEGRFIDGNKAVEEITTYPKEALIGRNILELGLLSPQELPKAVAALARSTAGEPTGPSEYTLIRKDGSPVTLEIRSFPIEIKGQRVVLGIARDITQRKQAEAALQASEALLRATFEQATVGITYVDVHGKFFQANDWFCQMLGYSRDELLTMNVAEVTHPDDLEATIIHLRQMEAGKRTSYTLEKRYIRKDGAYVWANLSVSLVRVSTSGLKYAVGVIEDITARKQIEEELRRNHSFLQTLMDNLPVSVFVKTIKDGRFVLWNKANEQLTGLPTETALGHTDYDFFPKEQADFFRQKDHEVFEKRMTIDIPEELVDSQPLGRRVLHTIKTPIYDESNTPVYLLGMSEDITERKQAEEALRAQNEQLQARNKELDAFARTVAHDLKNPLGALTTIAEILLEDYSLMPAEKLGEYLQSIVRGGQRASQIVESLLLLAGVRQRTVTLEPLDMAAIVTESLQRLAGMIELHQAEIIMPDTWPAVLGYAPWVEEVWVNYLTNGLKYGGRPPRLELGAAVQPDSTARFWVRDNGFGLTPQAQAQLFTEFTQLEPNRADGYGLGLSIVRRIVEKLGGQVGVESEGVPGRGSTFSFTLSLAQ